MAATLYACTRAPGSLWRPFAGLCQHHSPTGHTSTVTLSGRAEKPASGGAAQALRQGCNDHRRLRISLHSGCSETGLGSNEPRAPDRGSVCPELQTPTWPVSVTSLSEWPDLAASNTSGSVAKTAVSTGRKRCGIRQNPMRQYRQRRGFFTFRTARISTTPHTGAICRPWLNCT